MAKNSVIHKNDKTSYCIVGIDEMFDAMRSLTGAGFKLYMYLCKNKDNSVWALREKHALDSTGLSRNTYYKAMNDLKNQGYILESKNQMDFYEESQNDEL